MAIDRSLAWGRAYGLTEQGREAAAAEESCDCVLEWRGGVLGCPKCSTVWTLARSGDLRGTLHQAAIDWKRGH